MEAPIKAAVYWSPRTSLVCVENTHNRAGGRVFPQKDARAIAERARARGLAVHLDGARLWNASVAAGLAAAALAAPFDTVSVCFSKGLGAPVGSALARDAEARRGRAPLPQDVGRRNAAGGHPRGRCAPRARPPPRAPRRRPRQRQALAERLTSPAHRGLRVDAARVETNIVNIDLDWPADDVASARKKRASSSTRPAPRASAPSPTST